MKVPEDAAPACRMNDPLTAPLPPSSPSQLISGTRPRPTFFMARRSCAAPVFSNPPKKTTPGEGLRHRAEERQWVGSWVEGAADGLASELRVCLLEVVRDLATAACVVDHECPPRTEVMEREPGERRCLDVVRRREADVVDPVGMRRAHVERAVARFREPRVCVCGAALQQAGRVRDRDLGECDLRCRPGRSSRSSGGRRPWPAYW